MLDGKNVGKLSRFSSENQPAHKGRPGRKNTKEIRRLIQAFGETIAPHDLLNNDKVAHFLEANKLQGTYNEVLIAKLYSLAIRTTSLKDLTKAIDTIIRISGDNKKEVNSGITINFISPPSIEQEKSIILENDSFSVVTPVDDSTPTQ